MSAVQCFDFGGDGYIDIAREIGEVIVDNVDVCQETCTANKDCKSFAFYAKTKQCALSAAATDTPLHVGNGGKSWHSNYETFTLATCPPPADPNAVWCFNSQGNGFFDGKLDGEMLPDISTAYACQERCAANTRCKAFSYSMRLQRCALTRRPLAHVLTPNSVGGKVWHASYETFSVGECDANNRPKNMSAVQCFGSSGDGYIDIARQIGAVDAANVDVCEETCAAHNDCKSFAYYFSTKQCALSAYATDTPNLGKAWSSNFETFTLTACPPPADPNAVWCFNPQGSGYFDGPRDGDELSDIVTTHACRERCAATKKCKAFSYSAIKKRCDLTRRLPAQVLTPNSVGGKSWYQGFQTFSVGECDANSLPKNMSLPQCFGAIGDGYIDSGMQIGELLREDEGASVDTLGGCEDMCAAHKDCKSYAYYARKKFCALSTDVTADPLLESNGGKSWMINYQTFGLVECAARPDVECFNWQGQGYFDGAVEVKITPVTTTYACQSHCAATNGCRAFAFSPSLKRCDLTRRLPGQVLMPGSPGGKAWHGNFATSRLGACAPEDLPKNTSAAQCFKPTGDGYIDGTMQIGSLLTAGVSTQFECEDTCAAHKDCKSYAYYARTMYCALSSTATDTPALPTNGGKSWTSKYESFTLTACEAQSDTPQCFNLRGSGYIEGGSMADLTGIATAADCQAQCAATKRCVAFSHSITLLRCALSARVPTEILLPGVPSGEGRVWHTRYSTFSLGDCATSEERCFQGIGQGYISGIRLGVPIRDGVDTREACQVKCEFDRICQSYAYNEGRKHCVLSTDKITTPQMPFNGGESWTVNYEAYTIADCSSIEDTPAVVGKCFDLVGDGYFDGRRSGTTFRTGVESVEKCQDKCVAEGECKGFSYNPGRQMCALTKDAVGNALVPDTGGLSWYIYFVTYTQGIC